MRILITGAGGFIGQFLTKELLKDSSNTLVLTDVIECPIPKGSKNPQNATVVKADLLQDRSMVTKDLDAVYLFHGIDVIRLRSQLRSRAESQRRLDEGYARDYPSHLSEYPSHSTPAVKPCTDDLSQM